MVRVNTVEMSEAESQNILAVILAAGESRRFGSPKQLAPWFGQPLLQHVIDTTLQVYSDIWLMLGAKQDVICEALSLDAVRVIKEQEWANGMGRVIARAARLLREELSSQECGYDGVLFLLGDQPLLTRQDLLCLQGNINKHPDKIVCAEYIEEGGRKEAGVPVYFPCAYLAQLERLALQGRPEGAKALIQCNEHISISFDERLRDIDTKGDLESLIAGGLP